jgi:hypothetical protein
MADEDWEALANDPANENEDGKYLCIDEFGDVLISLSLLKDCLEKISDDASHWKWAIISAHSALQCACVCLLTRTDGSGALADKSTKNC